MVDREEFIKTVFEGREGDENVLLVKKTGDSWASLPADSERVPRWFRGKGAPVYFCVSTVKTPEPDEETGNLYWKRGRDNLIAAYVIVLDDIGTKVEEMPPVEPSYKLESSEGNFQWGYLIDGVEGDDLFRYEEIVAGLGEMGWTDKGAGGSYRVMRIPGSLNDKPGKNNFVSRITDWNPDRVWDMDDLAKELGVDLSAVGRAVRGRTERVGGADIAPGVVVPDPFLEWMSENEMVVEDKGAQWVDILCPWANEHTTGSNTAGYSPLGRGEGQWAERRAFKCLHEHCRDKNIKKLVENLAQHGAPVVNGYDPIPFYQARYTFVEEAEAWADMFQRPKGGFWCLSDQQFNKRYKRKVETVDHDRPVNVTTALLEDADTHRAMVLEYLPDQSDTVMTPHGQLAVNTYIEPPWVETKGVPEKFLEHVAYLLPDVTERECLLDWLAYKVQHPSSRSYAIVMVANGVFGIGRSFVGKFLDAAMMGQIQSATLPQLVGKGTAGENTYNDWAAECQFLVIEEVKDISREDFFSAYETFKERVDMHPTKFWRNTKYGAARADRMWWNLLMFSNHDDALALPNNDRRVAVFTNPTEIRDYGYYERLSEALSTEPASLYWYLKRRDVSKFDHVYPPMTKAKQKMIDLSVSPLEDIMDKVMEDGGPELVTMKTLTDRCRKAAREGGHDRYITDPTSAAKFVWRRINKLREDKNGARYKINGDQVEVRAMQNFAFWKDVDAGRDVAEICNGLGSGSSGANLGIVK